MIGNTHWYPLNLLEWVGEGHSSKKCTQYLQDCKDDNVIQSKVNKSNVQKYYEEFRSKKTVYIYVGQFEKFASSF